METLPYRPKRQIVGTIVLTLLMISALALAFMTRQILLGALIGLGLGVLLAPIINFMQRKLRLKRGLAALLLLVLILGGMGGLGFGVSLFVSGQAEQLQEKLPEIRENVRSKIGALTAKFPAVSREVQQQSKEMAGGPEAKQALNWVLGGIQSGLEAIAGLFVILTIALYTAVNARNYLDGVLTLFPAYLRPKAKEIALASSSVLRTWFRGQIIVMAAVGVMTALGLWAIGVDYWIVFGVMSAILDIIPYVGPVVSAAITALVTLALEPDKVPWVLALFLVAQQIEGDLILPLVMKGQAQLPEVHLIILMLILGSWFGILGALVAPPLLAVGRTIYLMTYKARMDLRKSPGDPYVEKPAYEAPGKSAA